jgi:hypothetical protein
VLLARSLGPTLEAIKEFDEDRRFKQVNDLKHVRDHATQHHLRPA